ncbi:PD-(D/E)XK motif protein [Subtercola sp. RTI3]|uniref:PD-(D/E)XK motif protein n=1 Tax=Subtercola sp. RTI3 TaxID=3048639 RepID=UPI002B226C9E|nr:PD-(D/E)XK motif protein [Subtercola sp. RTI3]MEA9984612.1 PD-(D/E)XK motif protein [Subtercola sp. RTI3]
MPELGLTTIRAAWELLNRPTESELNSFPLEVDDLEVRVAVDSNDGRHLLVELLTDVFQPGTGQHLSESIRSLKFGDDVRTYLDISVADPRLTPEFDMLIVDVLSEEEISAIRVHEALDRWRTLFRLLALRIMPRERILGLAGELFLLRAMLLKRPDLVAAWKGPAGGIHDFEIDRACIEVKSVTPRSASVTIHGLKQLEIDRAVPLLLVTCVFEEVVGGPTIADRIEEIRGLAVNQLAFEEALRRSGWTDASAPGPRFELIDAFVVRVGLDTPRLLPAESDGVPVGIIGAEYEIDLERLRLLADEMSPESMIAELLS